MIPARPSEHQKSYISHDTSGGEKRPISEVMC